MLSWANVVRAASVQDALQHSPQMTPDAATTTPSPPSPIRDNVSVSANSSSAASMSTLQPPPLPTDRQQAHHHTTAAPHHTRPSSVPPPIPAHLLSTPPRLIPSPPPSTSATPSPSSAALAAAMIAELSRRLSIETVHAVSDERRDSEKREKEKQQKRRWYQLLSKPTSSTGDDGDDSNHSAAAASPTVAASPTSTSSNGSASQSFPAQLTHAGSFTSNSSASSPSPSSATSGWSFIRKSKALLSSPDGQQATRPLPPPINTTTVLSPSPTAADRPHPALSPAAAAAAPSLHMRIDDIVSRAAFASSFRSFLVSRYCQENIDFLLAVNRFTESFQREHPSWKVGEESKDDEGEEERGRVVYAASVKESGVDIAHDKSHYVSLDIDATADGGSVGPAATTNLPKTALDIYHTYILLTGSQTVNIPAHTRQTIEHTVNSLQQHNNSGIERQPLSATLTPALFTEAVAEIEGLLEREWLTKYYHTQQYATLVQWMDKRERHILKREQATRQKNKLQEQLRRVAAAVRTPEPSPRRTLQPVNGSPHSTQGAAEDVDQQLTPRLSPLSLVPVDVPLSPISGTLLPSAVRAVGRMKGREGEDRIEQLSVSGNESEWPGLCDPDTPASPLTPSAPSPAAPRPPKPASTPASPVLTGCAPLLSPISTPTVYLSQRSDTTRRTPPPIPVNSNTPGVNGTPHHHFNDSLASIAVSDMSVLSASFLLPSSPAAADTTAFSTPSKLSFSQSSSSPSSPTDDYAVWRSPSDTSVPPTPSSATGTPATSDKTDKRRRPQAIVTPLPFKLHEADDEHKPRPQADRQDEGQIDFSHAPTLLIQCDEQDDSADSHRVLDAHTSAGKHPTHSPEPSTASLNSSPSPVAGAWPETSTSNASGDKGYSDVGDEECSDEVDEDDEERELFDNSTDGTRFFSVVVVEDSDDEADGSGGLHVSVV